MLYIGNFYFVSNQEEELDLNRRHGEFNLMIEADNTEIAINLFKFISAASFRPTPPYCTG